jgi:VCBS repeat-containing protein
MPTSAAILVNSYTASDQQSQQITALSNGGWVITWESWGQDETNVQFRAGVYAQAYKADGSELGGETRVNTVTANNQTNPQITALSDGGWVITWLSGGQDNTDGLTGVYAQAYKADGTKLGTETPVNTHTTNYQTNPQITALRDGGWVITWESLDQDGASFGVYAQAYDADGSELGGETRVNSSTAGDQHSQQITALSDGGWVITWESWGQDGAGWDVYAQAYNSEGSVQGTETRVNTHTTNYQTNPQITALSDGGWVITWMSTGQDETNKPLGSGVYAQAYHADGSQQGTETRVNTHTADDQTYQQITALSGGGWVITWMSLGQDETNEPLGSGVYAQAYNADGSVIGTETRANTHTADYQHFPQITALSDGGWVITWQSLGQDNAGWGVYAQAYNADGSVIGTETRVNTHTASSQELPQITALSDGGWVITWQSDDQDGDRLGVYSRSFERAGGEDTIDGTAAADTITFTSLSTTVNAGEGANTITGTSGDNLIIAGAGADTITVTFGDNIINAGDGANTITATSGNNTIISRSGADTITFTSGNNIINAGDGANTIVVTSGINMINTGDGADTITTGGLAGGGNAINAGDGANTIITGLGDDTITAGDDADTITTGGGHDVVYAGDGANTITTGAGNDTVYSGVDIDIIDGGDGDDTLLGGGGNDEVKGGDGNDTLLGGDDDDRLDGGHGNDTLTGGAGNDAVKGGHGDDETIYVASDNVDASDDYRGGQGIDTLTLMLSNDKWFDQRVQDDIARYLTFLADDTKAKSGETDGHKFQFTAFNLEVREFENLRIFVDGVELSPEDDPVTLRNDVVIIDEDDAQSDFGGMSVLDNDDVLDLVRWIRLIEGPQAGQLVFDPGTEGHADGSFRFDPAGDFEWLGEEETTQVQFTYKVQDADGDIAQANVIITVTGTNDGPIVISSEEQHIGGVTEDTGAMLETSGVIAIRDLDLSDGHTADFELISSDANADLPGYSETATLVPIGTFIIDEAVTGDTTDDDNTSSLGWRFVLSNADPVLQSLAADQTLTQIYRVTLTDDYNATVRQDVTVTITGIQDAPTIVAEATQASVTFIEDTAIVLATEGTIEVRNLDLIDGHTASFVLSSTDATADLPGFSEGVGPGVANLGTFTIDPYVTESVTDTANTATLGWQFELNNDHPVVQSLAEGQAITQVYSVIIGDVLDEVTQDITISIRGTNDKPVILGGMYTGRVEERPESALGDEMLTTGGTVNFGDVDLLDIHELKFDANGSGYLGTFTAEFSDTATNDGLGEVSWSFEVADSVLNHLYEGQVLFQSYTLILTDDKGGVVTPTVTVRIDGTNDTPVAEIDTAQLLPGGRVELDVLANDSDVDGDRMTISAVTPAGQGTVTIEGNKLVYIADTDASPGVDVVRYTITDPFGGMASATAAFVIGSSQYASATVGSDRSEVLTASDNADIVLGGLGDDTIQAEGGDDLIVWAAGDGNDVIYGGEGFDRLELDLPEDSSDGIRVYADAVGNVIVSGGTFTLTIDGVEDLSFVGGEGGANITFGDLSTTDLANQTIYYRSANGSTANDYMDGGYANKTLHFYGGYGNDTLIGDHFNDVLNGDSGSDVIYGGDGDDRIDGGHHREGGPYPNSPFVPASSVVDMLYGGGGNDTIHGYSARAIVYGGTGIDWIWTGEADDLIWTDGAGTSFINGIEYVQAGGGNDTIYGGNARDNIFGGSGNDEIYGAEGDDSLSGDAGADTIHGGSGSDLITGGTDADLLYGGGGGIDTLNGGNGNDVIYTESDATSYSYAKGENGNDTIIGGAGRDIVDGGADNDSIEGGGGDDILEGSVGQDTVRGGSGSDLITDISYDTNQLFGNDGNDHIVGIGYIDGGAGNDYIVSRSSFDTVHGGDGDDLIYMDDTIGILSTVNYLYGDAGNDRIQVFSAGTPLYLDGGTGDDNLYILDTPYMGDATLLGGNGNDRLNASSGNDQLFGGSDYGADELWGRGGNDLLDGGYGADTMRGGAGDDVYHYRDIAQDIYESVGGGSDTLISHVVNVTILDEFEFLVLSDGAYHATGNSKNNTITGNGNGNWINGLAGNDVLNGAGGNDWLYAGGGDDTIYGGAGSDTLFAGGQFEWIPNDDRRDSQVLNGGAGADTFSFAGSHWLRNTSVTIQDFNPLEDVLDMSYFGYLDEDVWGNAPGGTGNMSDWEFATQRLSFGPSSSGLGNTTVTAIGLQITLIDVNWHQLDDYNTML